MVRRWRLPVHAAFFLYAGRQKGLVSGMVGSANKSRKNFIFKEKYGMPVNKSALLRYHIIDECLTNTRKKYPSLMQIMEKIEEVLENNISESMLNKDIAAMKKIYNAPIYYNRLHKGYCYSEPDFSIKKFPLTDEEINALDFSTALLNQLKGTKMFEQFENAVNKVIEGYRFSKLAGKSERKIFQAEEAVRTEANKWLEELLNSVVHGEAVDIQYKSFNKVPKTHEFSPYLLKEYRHRWYVVGFSQRADKIIVLALDRIEDIRPSGSKYRSDPDFDPDSFFQYSFGITQFHDASPESIVLSFKPEEALYIISQPMHHSQKILLQNEEEVRIRMKLFLTPELTMTILSFGSAVKVISPETLQAQIKKLAEETSALYP